MHKCRLSDIATFSQGKQIPVEEQFVHKAQNLNRFIRIIDYTDQSTEPRYTNENSDRYKVSKTDLVMIRYGSQTAGKVVRGFDGVIANNMFRINFITPENYDMNFMYFYLSSPHIYNFLMKAQVSSTMPAITFDMLSDIWITIPELHRQKLIGEVLNTINIKIELNNKINAELEGIAHDLYNYWFVQFDFPDEFRRPYKSSGGKMIYNDVLKREIPEGWTMDTLGNICNLYQPETISEKDCDPNGKYYVYGSNGIIGRYNKKNHNDSEIVISCRGDCGNIIRTMPNVWITGNAMVVHPKSNVSQEFIYFALQNAGIKRIITGSVQGQITRKNLEPVKIVMPPLSLLEQYEQLVCDNVNTRIQNDIETELLQKLRDFLLPMLMNGQVSVSD